MFSSGITDGNIKIRDTAWRFNDNGCTQDLFLFKSFSPDYKQYALGLASVRITSLTPVFTPKVNSFSICRKDTDVVFYTLY